MKKNNHALFSKNITLRGKTRTEIISMLGDNYILDDEGNMTFSIKVFMLIKQKIYIAFDENDIAEVVITK